MNESAREVFVEQPLALPGSDKNFMVLGNMINRPGVAGAVSQSPLSDPLAQISSEHCQSQTGRAR